MVRERLAAIVVVCAIAPLFAPEVWSGFRLALSDVVLSVFATTEQPLSVRSPAGVWAMLLALIWFGLAYWQRRMKWWEPLLVALGGAAALARLGNSWLFGLAMLPPLTRQLLLVRPRPELLGAVALVSLGVTAATLVSTRPPGLSVAAERAALSATTTGSVFADWRWAAEIQRQFGQSREVRAAQGLASETPEFWFDYARIIQGHERWDEALQTMHADLIVLDSAEQARAAASLVRESPDWRVTYDTDGVVVAERSRT